jgi:serine protease Do
MEAMEKRNRRAAPAALLALALLVVSGNEVNAQFSRRNPFVEAVEKTRPSIVTVKVEKRGNWGTTEIIGTGVIVDERGYLITNSHVVNNGESFVIVLSDGSELKATLHTEDANHDLAILQVKTTKKLKPLPFGPASDLMVGETVFAIGHPFGYRNTVSTGIVSALGREIGMPSGATLKELIQTNTPINPGNSGGPLMNINGELIGINVALREGAQGIAFALNADMVQKVLAEHLSAAKVAKVKHGLVCKERVVAEEGDNRQQVVIEDVLEKTPAAAAGLKRGDIIKMIGERRVSNRFDVERALWDHKSGEKIDAVVIRGEDETHVSLTLGAASEVAAVATETKEPASKEKTQRPASRD